MSKLAFLRAKLWGNEAYFQGHSTPVNPDLINKSVALVGNARALGKTSFGPDIDSADIVVRINSAPMPDATSHGTRTDWLAMSTPVDAETLKDRAPSRQLWMTRKRKRLGYLMLQSPGFHLHDVAMIAKQREELGSSPTTGLMMIDLLLRSEAREIHLYGFDFFNSLSLSGARTAAQVPHDFNAEKQWVQTRLDLDPRLTLHSSAD